MAITRVGDANPGVLIAHFPVDGTVEVDLTDLREDDLIALPTNGVGELVRVKTVGEGSITVVVWIDEKRWDGVKPISPPPTRTLTAADFQSPKIRPFAVIRFQDGDLKTMTLPEVGKARQFYLIKDSGSSKIIVTLGQSWEELVGNNKEVPLFCSTLLGIGSTVKPIGKFCPEEGVEAVNEEETDIPF